MLKPSDFVFTLFTTKPVNNVEMTLEEMEKKLIIETMKRYNSNMSIVA